MKHFASSATVSINDLALQKLREGKRVFNFAAGDPVLPNHPLITRSAVIGIEKSFSPYPPVEGIPQLRQAAADWLNDTCQTRFQKDNILVTSGGKFALFASLFSLLDPTDEVLIAAPYWVSYPEMIKMAGGVPKVIHSHPPDWKITPQHILNHLSEKTRLLILNNACNPTGVTYSREEIRLLLKTCQEAGLIVIADEVYSGLVYEEEFISCGSFSEYEENVIIAQSCSKNFAMAGWRIGFIAASERWVKKFASMQSQTITSAVLASQWAALGALENYEEVNSYVKKAMVRRRDLFVLTYSNLFGKPLQKPSSALYAFIPLTELTKETNSIKFCQTAIAEASVAIVPGTAFGTESFVRFAYSNSEEDIREGLKALKQI